MRGKLGTRQQAVVDALREHGGSLAFYGIQEALAAFGNGFYLAPEATSSVLRSLLRRGVIEREGPAVYRLVPDERSEEASP